MSGVMSEYFKLLSEENKPHYLKKLTLPNGYKINDPCAIKERYWSDDVLLLPDIQSLDMYHYLINTPSEFTHESLKAYKSLEAYNFFVCGHVHDIFIHKVVDAEFIILKSMVLPSQRQGQKEVLYEVWCIVHQTGWIHSRNCTCMAG